jgi:diacylglycerol kinase (ATP)
MSFSKRIKSFSHAFRGVGHLLRTEANARIHLTIMVLVSIFGLYFGITRSEWLVILLCFSIVMSLEAMNTAIERLTDLASPGRHPLAGHAKDVAAAAVLWSAIMSVIIGLVIFWPYVFDAQH